MTGFIHGRLFPQRNGLKMTEICSSHGDHPHEDGPSKHDRLESIPGEFL